MSSKFHPKWTKSLLAHVWPLIYFLVLIRSALESSDPCASNGGSSFEIESFGADLASFEVASLKWVCNSWIGLELAVKISSVFTRRELGIFCSCLLLVVLIQSALESPDNCAFNGGSNVGIRYLGAELVSLELWDLTMNWPIISDRENWGSWFQALRLFKSDELGRKVSDLQVWPTIRRAMFRAFRRTSNQHRTTKTRAKNSQFADCKKPMKN